MSLTELFGSMVFNDSVMQQRLPHDTYRQLKRILQDGGALDRSIADIVANAMKDWAIEKGATHFTHWFQPMTGITAEKHDAFIRPVGDGVIMEFSGKELIKGESDASSFPSGGLRATFEARGYTAWDPTSYAFIKDKTLCIPTAFCSYTGEALDKKTPLLRSMELINRAAVRMLKLLGINAGRVSAMVGAEQEYFLIDREMYEKRPDLIYTGRTLIGHRPSKGQELDDHFFGALKTRVSAFMRELDEELWMLGIPAKTCHNEAAPAQHELASVYESVNVAVDHNQLTMEIMKKVATRHGMVCLLHEKPFDGVNGSGKHNNWSLQTDTGLNLLKPGDAPADNLAFLLTICAVIQAVDDYQELMRISVASAGNDHRLGGNEAPPAIMSMYLGDDITALLKSIAKDKPLDNVARQLLDAGVGTLSRVTKDNTDRNRTSPLAFTGNKFEFRSVGSSFSIADANVVINTAVADKFFAFSNELEGAKDVKACVYAIVKQTMAGHARILFDGNNYSEEWRIEAQRRGLKNLKDTVSALKEFTSDKNVELFTRNGIFSETEMLSRREVMLENYAKVVNIEAHTLIDMVKRDLLPAIIRYSNSVCTSLQSKTALGVRAKAEKQLLELLSGLTDDIWDQVERLEDATANASEGGVTSASAEMFSKDVLASMNDLRNSVDQAEALTDAKEWPYPSYGELLSSVHE